MKRVASSMAAGLVVFCLTGIQTANAFVTIGDLTTNGSEVTLNGAIFRENDIGPTGSGVLDPFVRIAFNGNVEQGYNTSGRPLAFNENNSPIFTHDLLLSSVPVFNISGTLYREFVLDINQTGTDPLLSLDVMRVYLSNTGNFANPSTNLSTLGTLIWELDGNLAAGETDRWVKLNYNLNTGSGSGDLRVFVPDSLFTGGYQYVYLYSKFGVNENNNDGFEEWAVRTGLTCQQTNTCTPPPPPPGNVPEPASMLLMGTGLLGFLGLGASRKRRI